MSTLAKIGFCELALGAVLGWGVVARLERPELLTRAGIVAPRRVLQAHLDYIMMGLILIGTGLALGHLQSSHSRARYASAVTSAANASNASM